MVSNQIFTEHGRNYIRSIPNVNPSKIKWMIEIVESFDFEQSESDFLYWSIQFWRSEKINHGGKNDSMLYYITYIQWCFVSLCMYKYANRKCHFRPQYANLKIGSFFTNSHKYTFVILKI